MIFVISPNDIEPAIKKQYLRLDLKQNNYSTFSLIYLRVDGTTTTRCMF